MNGSSSKWFDHLRTSLAGFIPRNRAAGDETSLIAGIFPPEGAAGDTAEVTPPFVSMLPQLVQPGVAFGEQDYAKLQAQLSLYNDFIVLKLFQNGHPVTDFVVDPTEVAASLSTLTLGSGFLPPNTLFWAKKGGQDYMGVYIEPQVWVVSLRGEKQVLRVPLPGLVFTGRGYDYSLWAVQGRPTSAAARLYVAPCPNLTNQGVCRGNAPFPEAHPNTIWSAVEVFFTSRFNQDLGDGKSKRYPQNVLNMWRHLSQNGAEEYLLTDLVETNFTLERLINVD